MRKQSKGSGCLLSIGITFAAIAIFHLILGFQQSPEGAKAFLPFVGSALAAALCLGVADLLERVSRIEKHLGIDRKDKLDKTNSNNVPEDIVANAPNPQD